MSKNKIKSVSGVTPKKWEEKILKEQQHAWAYSLSDCVSMSIVLMLIIWKELLYSIIKHDCQLIKIVSQSKKWINKFKYWKLHISNNELKQPWEFKSLIHWTRWKIFSKKRLNKCKYEEHKSDNKCP
jgi:hypothetical protein